MENSIFSNEGLGIDLSSNFVVTPVAAFPVDAIFIGQDGVDANDNLDPDIGANNLQNFPVLKSAEIDKNKLKVEVELRSEPKKTYHPFIIYIEVEYFVRKYKYC